MLLLAAGLVGVVAIWLPRALDPDGVGAVRAEGAASELEVSPTLLAAPLEEEIVGREVASEEASSTPVKAEGLTMRRKPAAMTNTPSGRLHVRAIDAATKVGLDRIRVRVMSQMRVADRASGRGGFEVGLTLTPGTYAVLVMVPGYEPTELTAVHVPEGDRVELPLAEMRAGSARILGTVGRTLEPGETLLVELMGMGRRPCVECSPRFGLIGTGMTGDHGAGHSVDHCPQCGFGPDRSRLLVRPAGDFAFDGLASGNYALRLGDGRGHDVGEQVSLELREAECARIEMDSPIPRTLRVELVDTDGASLAGAWGANVRHRRAVHDARDRNAPAERPVGKLEWRFEFYLDTGDVQTWTGTFETPTAPGTTSAKPAPFGGRKLGSGRKLTVDDKPLRGGETLRLEPDEPRFAISPIEARVDEEGLVVFEGVSASKLKLVLLSGAFRATVDLRSSSEAQRATAHLEDVASTDTIPATFRAFESARYR